MLDAQVEPEGVESIMGGQCIYCKEECIGLRVLWVDNAFTAKRSVLAATNRPSAMYQ
jgi:hypothetical protein